MIVCIYARMTLRVDFWGNTKNTKKKTSILNIFNGAIAAAIVTTIPHQSNQHECEKPK